MVMMAVEIMAQEARIVVCMVFMAFGRETLFGIEELLVQMKIVAKL